MTKIGKPAKRKTSAGRAKTLKHASSISFSGIAGSYSDMSCRAMFPRARTLPCVTFDDAFAALNDGRVDLAMIPIENAIAGRVADVHHLIPRMQGLHVVAEHFQPVEFCLLGTKDSTLKTLTHVHSHVMALPQCRKATRALGLKEVTHEDTAGAAEMIAKKADPTQGALASALAAELYGLKILKRGIQNTQDNVTRFVVFSKEKVVPDVSVPCLTAFIFVGKSIPAFLYKVLGAFATNQINFTKIESYVEDFRAAHFYCEVEGHPDERRMQLAFDEVAFYTTNDYRILGTFPQAKFRLNK
ncbi:MAG: prephenate dehydratase [Rhodospirillales bacterium]|nr:prephenate dehydratase [Alphaproteobacteria bacterium]MCB9986916.1 prephenate dehydratase [Rhodospirillales bacterium]USO08308.1 MAG: prephenate dehydratase [Rhodospirillales bacterium]